jgi:hypothetical protein
MQHRWCRDIACFLLLAMCAGSGLAQSKAKGKAQFDLVKAWRVPEFSYDRLPEGKASLKSELGTTLVAVQLRALKEGETEVSEADLVLVDSRGHRYLALGAAPGELKNFVLYANVISGGATMRLKTGESIRLQRPSEKDPIRVGLKGPPSSYVFVYRIPEKSRGLRLLAAGQTFPISAE